MSLVGNILWIVLGGGVVLAFEYLAGGLALCVTLIGIPFGIQAFKLAVLALLPFGRTIGERQGGGGALSMVMNILWFFVGGVWLVVTHLVFALLCALTVVGIPFGVQHLKLAALALTPFGREIR